MGNDEKELLIERIKDLEAKVRLYESLASEFDYYAILDEMIDGEESE